MPRKRTRSKFGVSITEAGKQKRTSVDYITGEPILFDQETEKKYYDQVVVQGMMDGTITKYKLQNKYILQPSFKYRDENIRAITYISDFDIWYADGSFEVIDIKGLATQEAKMKQKMFKYVYPDITIKWLCYSKATGWIEYKEMEKIRKAKKKGEK